MVVALDSRLRSRGFDFRSFRFQTSTLETLLILAADLKILRMCQISTNCVFTRTIPSFISDAIVTDINSRPVCTSQPYSRPGSDCARTERQPSVRKLRSGSPRGQQRSGGGVCGCVSGQAMRGVRVVTGDVTEGLTALTAAAQGDRYSN